MDIPHPHLAWSSPMTLPPLSSDIQGVYGDRICTLGSCFSEHIGSYIRSLGYDVLVNPYGPLYNPISICQTLEGLLSECAPDYTPTIITRAEGCYSLQHHSRITAATPELLLNHLEELRLQTRTHLLQCQWLWLTFGTTRLFRHRPSGACVANCQKLPAGDFDRIDPSLDTLQDRVTTTLLHLQAQVPVRIIVTVSPVYYLHDGLVESSLSKSKLRLLCEHLTQSVPACYYFPAYELQRDELRDYRFYTSDHSHPSLEAVEYIGAHFVRYWASSDDSQAQLRQASHQLRRLALHRPLTPSGVDQLQHSVQRQAASLQARGKGLISLAGILADTPYVDLSYH